LIKVPKFSAILRVNTPKYVKIEGFGDKIMSIWG